MDTKELTEIVVTDTFEEWYMELDEKQGDAVVVIISLLEKRRAQSWVTPTQAQSVILLGGDKRGQKDFYKQMVPQAEKLWERYLKEEE